MTLLRKISLILLAANMATACGSDAHDRGTLAESDDVAPKSGIQPCSQRLSLVRAPQLDPGASAKETIKSTFRAERMLGVEENIDVLPANSRGGTVLRVQYPKGSINFGSRKEGRPLGGASFYAPISDSENLCVHYKVRFPEDFAFVKGGKLPGLYGGKAPSGGQKVTGRDGWSIRLMWRADGDGELYEYIFNKDDDYGLSVGRGNFRFPRGRWVDVDLEVKINDPGQKNGIARLWIDGKGVIEQNDIIYDVDRRKPSDAGLMFSTFFGGSDDSWATPKDQYIEFSDFRLYSGRP